MSRYGFDGEPLYQCAVCGDTGFMRGSQGHGIECPGNGRCGIGQCGRTAGTTYPHTYTRHCSCRASNPALAELRQKINDRAKAHHEEKARTA